MSAIRVENLSKRYRVNTEQSECAYRTLRESIVGAAGRLATRLRGQRPTTQLRDFWALQDLSFEVRPGEVIGIIGRNGSGKSTLLKILSRITKPTSGYCLLRGRVASLLEVGTGFHPELTGRENIFLNGSILGMTRAEVRRRFDEIVAFAEVEQFLDTPVKRYSSGMYVRLAFAVAAHLEPEILVVDEVLAVGDAAFQAKCLRRMHQASVSGTTVLLVSHNMAAVLELCTRALLLEKGRLAMTGNPALVADRYLNMAIRSETGVFPLEDHGSRSAEGRPVLRRLTLRSADGSPTSCFLTGERFRFDLEIDPPQRLADARIALAIEDRFGRRLTTVATWFQPDTRFDLDARCVVSGEIPSLRLGPGSYLVSLSIATKSGGLVDDLRDVCSFDVSWRNDFQNGEPYDPVFGPVLTDCSWRMSQ